MAVATVESVSGAAGCLHVQSLPTETIRFAEIRTAACRIRPYVKRTPLVRDEALSRRFNANIYLKLELLQNTGAFKVRGAFNKILSLPSEKEKRGIIAVSGGNHAQAVAYAAKTLGHKALILMPEITPHNYIAKTESYGAEVLLMPTMTEAFAAAKKLEREGLVYIHPFADKEVIEGQGTIGLEIIDQLPVVTNIITSIGGGGLAGGVAAAVKAIKPQVNIHGVETRGAESMHKAMCADRIVHLTEVTSIARTLGAPAVAPVTLALAQKYLSDLTVVDDAEAIGEMFYLLENAKLLTEPATSCTVAALEKLKDKLTPASHVVLILCGGNIALDDLFRLRA